MGFALSRYSGLLVRLQGRSGGNRSRVRVGLIASLRSVEQSLLPTDSKLRRGGLNIRWAGSEARQNPAVFGPKMAAVGAFARDQTRLDAIMLGPGKAGRGSASWRPEKPISICPPGASELGIRSRCRRGAGGLRSTNNGGWLARLRKRRAKRFGRGPAGRGWVGRGRKPRPSSKTSSKGILYNVDAWNRHLRVGKARRERGATLLRRRGRMTPNRRPPRDCRAVAAASGHQRPALEQRLARGGGGGGGGNLRRSSRGRPAGHVTISLQAHGLFLLGWSPQTT